MSAPGRRPRSPDRPQRLRQVPGQRADQPGHHRVRRHRPGQGRLLPQHRDIGQAVTAQRQRRGQVRDDLARMVDRPRRPPPGQTLRQSAGQAGHPASSHTAGPHLPGTPAPGRQRTQPPGHHVRYRSPEKCLRPGTDGTLDKPNPPRSKALFLLADHTWLTPRRKPEANHWGSFSSGRSSPPGAPTAAALGGPCPPGGGEGRGEGRQAGLPAGRW